MKYLILPPIEIRSDVTVHHVGPLSVFYGSQDDRTNIESTTVEVGTFQVLEQEAASE